MIPTLRRGRDDVFVIGEEDLLLDADEDRTFAIEDSGGGSPRRRDRASRPPGSLHGARGLALLGLAAGSVAFLAVLELGGGDGPVRPHRTSPPRTPLISRSAARVPAGHATRAERPAARPAEVPTRSVAHHRSRRPQGQASPRPHLTPQEPEREPTPQMAPVSSPAVMGPDAAPEPERQPAATAGPTPPDPPPPSSGGGPGGVTGPPASRATGVESFGFER